MHQMPRPRPDTVLQPDWAAKASSALTAAMRVQDNEIDKRINICLYKHITCKNALTAIFSL